MRKTRNRLMGVLLLLCLLLSGCGSWKNYFHTEESLKREAAKALREKYDEEFVIHDAWSRSQTIFYVTCSPKNDMEVVFEAEVYKDGRGLRKDEYLQGVVSKQVSEKIQMKLKEVFGDNYYIKTHFYGDPPTIDEFIENYEGEAPSLDYLKNITVEEYYKMDQEPLLAVWIIINKEKLDYSENEAWKEYDVFSKLFETEVMKNAGFSGYFVDKSTFNECKNYFQKDNKARGRFDAIVENAIEFGFGINEGNINISFEEYNKIRMETEKNE